MKTIATKRMWYIMSADVEIQVDDNGKAIDVPLGEPEVLGMTYSVKTAELALGALTEDLTNSIVRSTVKALPQTLQKIAEEPSEEEKKVAQILEMVTVTTV